MVTAILKFDFSAVHCFARRKPCKLIAARTVQWSAEFYEIMRSFAHRDLSVTRRLKKRERLESAFTGDYGAPGFFHVAAGCSHDAEAGDDGVTHGLSVGAWRQ